MQLDPLTRAELETIAAHWRDVHPAGGTYTLDAMRVLDAQRDVGNLTGDEAMTIFMLIASYATHKVNALDLP